MQPQPQQGGAGRSLRVFIGWAQSLSLMHDAWLHIPSTCGVNHFRGQAALGWVVSFVIAAFSRNEDFMQYVLVTGALMIFHTIATHLRQHKGYRCHSRYVGTSWLGFLGGNRLACCVWEPLAAFFIGKTMVESGIGWGLFIMVVSVLMVVSTLYSAAAERAQITAMRDSRAESEWLSSYMDR
jgi:hypothetical protein